VSKLVAGRAKDLVFIASAIRHGLATLDALRGLLAETDLDEPIRAVCVERLGRLERA
jgi:hypothetical protein